MNLSYIKLGIATLLPVLLSVVLALLDRRTIFGKLNNIIKQAIFGVLFGGLAILGTEWGIPFSGAQANVRDGAVLCAGLFFGGPAGIIAGIIGAIERWIAVAWGVGSFTRVACTLSTFFAGIYGALLRRFMFENKKPGILISLAIGVVMEVFHLTMVFITNMNEPIRAMAVVKACTAPMVIANGVCVMLASIALSLTKKEYTRFRRDKEHISRTVQRWLLITVLLAFIATSYFVFSLQNRLATVQADSLLDLAINEAAADIQDASDEHLLSIARSIAREFEGGDLKPLCERYDVSEINIVNEKGTIIQTSEPLFINYKMGSGEQSAEFLCLLEDTQEFAQKYGPVSYDSSISRKYAGIKTDYGFIQVGYDAEIFQKDIDSVVVGITKNRHVGESGYILILDRDYQVVSAPDGYAKTSFAEEAKNHVLPKVNTTFEMTLDEPYYCRYDSAEGYYILSMMPTAEAFRLRNIALYVNAFLEILVFAILFLLIFFLIKRVVVSKITDVNASLEKITQGDLDEVVNVRSNEEFASLSDGINSTVSSLKGYIKEASEQINKELELAKNIQSSALPNVFPAFPKRKDFDIYACMDPAKEVGGDFYDFYLTNHQTLNFLVADVSGKGIPAAMFMMRAKTELKTLTEADVPLADVFTTGNRALCEGNDAGMFVTAWQGSIDLDRGLVQYANAGHNPPLVRHGDDSFNYLRSKPGFVLAGMDTIRYKTNELQLEPGDILFLYTDGVTEATNAEKELFGEERLLNAINSKDYSSMQELCDFIKSEVETFVAGAPQFDDITMVAFKYIGTPPPPSIHFEKAELADIPKVTAFVEEELEKLECPMKAVIQISIAIDEIYSNIVKYGYANKPGPITVEVIDHTEEGAVSLRFTDDGMPYNPLTKEDPDVTLSAEERNIGGLGIYMVKKTMDDMKYAYEDEKNILTITKRI